MGIFDSLEQAAGGFMGGGQAAGDQAAGDQAAAPGGATSGGALGAVIQMVQSHPGGLGGVMQAFQQGGLGGAVQSWMGEGANQSVSPDQVQDSLGSGPVNQVAQQLGVSPEEAAGHISQFLPQIMDHLSPGGQAPQGGALGELEGLMSRFGGGQAG